MTVRSLRSKLLAWYGANRRDLPWRRTRDPYAIWVSEIMLQQTRAEAVIPYYERFLARFPTIAALAGAVEPDVLAVWSGLGYYSRARNLHQAAREMGGVFPADYDAIRALPGVGDYTAAAVASIAFGLPHAALDGNVLRVIARLSNDASDIGAPATRARFRALAQHWLDPRRAGQFNEAMMELGATVCQPRAPRCGACPLAAMCEAHRAGTAAQLPVKLRKVQPVKLAMDVAVIMQRGCLLLWQRTGATRMAGFWELPAPDQLPPGATLRIAGTFRHTIMHRQYQVTVHIGELAAGSRLTKPLRWGRLAEVPNLPVSTIARKALRMLGGKN